MNASPESLTNSLLGSETTRQPCRLPTALQHLVLSKDPLKKTLAMPLVNLAHARHLDNIDPNSDVDTPWRTERSRQACHPCRPKQPGGYSHAPLPHQWRKQQRQVPLLHTLSLAIILAPTAGCWYCLLAATPKLRGPFPYPYRDK